MLPQVWERVEPKGGRQAIPLRKAIRMKIAFNPIIAAAVPVAAGPLGDGHAAYFRGDYATALRLLPPLADQGSVDAQLILGFMHANGQGVPQDYAAALAWYRKAADQGNAIAQHNLGEIYYDGHFV